MHAVVVSVTVNDGEAATQNLRSEVVPQIKQAPGFVAGYWVRISDGDKGRATVVFESEEAARTAADRVRDQAGEFVTVESVEVGEVVVSA